MFLSETINSNAVSIFATTTTFNLTINKYGDLTINDSNIIVKKPNTNNEKSNVTSSTCTSCRTCSCVARNHQERLQRLPTNHPYRNTTRRYSVIIDNNSNKDSVAYTETNYDDSRRMTNYTETNYNSRNKSLIEFLVDNGVDINNENKFREAQLFYAYNNIKLISIFNELNFSDIQSNYSKSIDDIKENNTNILKLGEENNDEINSDNEVILYENQTNFIIQNNINNNLQQEFDTIEKNVIAATINEPSCTNEKHISAAKSNFIKTKRDGKIPSLDLIESFNESQDIYKKMILASMILGTNVRKKHRSDNPSSINRYINSVNHIQETEEFEYMNGTTIQYTYCCVNSSVIEFEGYRSY
ncbi:hypothetical protein U3516DRAFT_741494 [Neocallimastix sp. 'constans']